MRHQSLRLSPDGRVLWATLWSRVFQQMQSPGRVTNLVRLPFQYNRCANWAVGDLRIGNAGLPGVG